MLYCENPMAYRRRATREVMVGRIGVGGANPIRVQSMITCDTMDTEASIAQTMELAAVGCEIVRITAPTVKDSANLEHIVRGLRERGCDVPVVADIHFKPEAAMEAAKWVDKVLINAYRLLVARLNEEGGDWNYPIHLGVTEAGEGEDARIKSAIGIGSLLHDGIGDTIRVSLTEDSVHEIPVARALVETGHRKAETGKLGNENIKLSFDAFSYSRRATETIERNGFRLGGEELMRVVVRQASFDKVAHKIDRMGDYKPEIVYENARVVEIDPRDEDALAQLNEDPEAQLVTVRDDVDLPVIAAFRLLAAKAAPRHPILLKDMF